MSGHQSRSKNKSITHGSTGEQCGREILPGRLRGKIVGRIRRFCSDRCRKAVFPSTDFARRNPPLWAGRNDENNPTGSIACKIDFTGRASPNSCGILDFEQPWRKSGAPIVSSDAVQCFVVGKLRRSR